MEARFLPPHVGGVHGLVNPAGTAVVPASQFWVGTTDKEVALDDTGGAIDLGDDNYVPVGRTISYNAKILVPGNQQVGVHNGVIELTFSAA